MPLLLLGLGLILLGGLAAVCAGRSGRLASVLGAGGCVTGCLVALAPALHAALSGRVTELRLPWTMPGGTLALGLDALSGFFLIPTLLLSGLAATYGSVYLRPYATRRLLGPSWFCFNLLAISMALVLVARNGLLFLVAWETMALASFFLVTFEHEQARVREAGWTYLVATHLGTACLLALFVLLSRETGSLDFARLAEAAPLLPAPVAGLVFLLALVGFGTKAGFVPLHVWLPEAHPAAPSHVSALLSGVMIKTGIYGLVRLLTLLGPPALWWGWVLVAVGVTSGILGVLLALAQHDLKRLLAYHSVENIGIITLGLGLGTIGLAAGAPQLAVLALGGGLLHVLNHAMFKGLLFLGAGAVLHATGTREIDRLGGLGRRMPWTSACFLVGAAAISGLPPLNGFVSEFLIALAALAGGLRPGGGPAVVPALVTLSALALIGGLAAACFTKAFGIVFLGEPRSPEAMAAHEAAWGMRLPMLLLAAGCALIGLLAPLVLHGLAPTLVQVTRRPEAVVAAALAEAGGGLRMAAGGAAVLILGALALALLRRRLLARRAVEETVTWDCGYAAPTTRMQYTASSFAQPLTFLFRALLRAHTALVPVSGLFPRGAAFASHTPDPCRESLFDPAFGLVAAALERLRVLQHGRVQLYVLSIVLTLIVLIVWKLG